MSKQDFLQKLEKFQEHLSEGIDLDEHIRDRLRAVQEDIDDILLQGTAAVSHRKREVVDSLKKIVEEFEVAYPEITKLLGQMAESLARMGI